MTDDDIKRFIEYFGEDNIPNPEHYPIRLAWMMTWYESIVMKNREDNNG
jgi:hypothetical protein|tara:strand:+ start:1127 stop:1273 length:147 start_codon:yes stop_codon:yes gene_type:complete